MYVYGIAFIQNAKDNSRILAQLTASMLNTELAHAFIY